jgi:hypothetical protein
MLVGTWFNCIFFTMEIALVVRYFKYSSRPLLHRVGTGIIFAFDTLCTFAICARVYLVVLVAPSRHLSLKSTLPTLAVILFSTSGTAAIVQLYMCCLYFKLCVSQAGFVEKISSTDRIRRTARRMITAFLLLNVAVHVILLFLFPGVG